MGEGNSSVVKSVSSHWAGRQWDSGILVHIGRCMDVATGQVASGTQEKNNGKALVIGCSHWAGRQWDMVNGMASRP